MMRLAPRSLFSRLVLVFLSVLVLAQLLSFVIHMHERGEELSQASGMQSAQRIADIVKLLEPLDLAARRRIVQVFSASPLAIKLDQPALRTPMLDAGDNARSALFGAMHAGVWPTPVPLTVMGIGLGCVAFRSGSLRPAIVAHALFNAVSALALLRG